MKTYLIVAIVFQSLSIVVNLAFLAIGKFPRRFEKTSGATTLQVVVSTLILVWATSLLRAL